VTFNGPEGIIQIPVEFFHPDGETVADLEEFRQLLRVMVFWILGDIPVGVLEFCTKNPIGMWEKSLTDLPGAAHKEIALVLLRTFSDPNIVPLETIVETGRWDLIVHAVGRIDKSSHATAVAAEHGNLRLLKYLHEQGFAWHGGTCPSACENGHLEILQYAHENGCPWEGNVYFQAAMYGHLSCMKYAFEHGLQEWHLNVCSNAALRGHLEIVQYAHENGCPWDSNVHTSAAKWVSTMHAVRIGARAAGMACSGVPNSRNLWTFGLSAVCTRAWLSLGL